MDKSDRLYALDAMRGIAAMVVVAWHFKEFATIPLGSGYLAVDFFFALSGVVIAKVYWERLTMGLGVKRFMLQRIIRLYPMFILGAVLMLAKATMALILDVEGHMSAPDLVVISVINGMMLPVFIEKQSLFPLNPPAWSLFLELLINFVFAVAVVKFGKRKLYASILVCAACLVAAVFYWGKADLGVDAQTLVGGLPRVGFAFLFGVALQRSGLIDQAKNSGLLFLAPIIALLVALLAGAGGVWRAWYDLAFVLLALPIIVAAGAILQPPVFLRPLCEALGDLSYPLYAVHAPLLFFAESIYRKGEYPLLAAFFVAQLLLAYALGRWLDPVLRGWLSSAFLSRRLKAASI